MDKPKTFDEVFKEAYDYWIDDANIHRYEGAKGLADQVWQHQQAKVEGLQEEFAEDERFLKEQIKDKDLKIANLEYLQGMDKELIQTLQGKSEKLQKRVDAVKQLIQDYLDEEKELELKEWEQSTIYGRIAIELEQALKGGEQ